MISRIRKTVPEFFMKAIPQLVREKLGGYYQYLHLRSTDFFESVDIETTTICNRQCPYCPQNYVERKEAFMDTSLFKRVIDQLHESVGWGTYTLFDTVSLYLMKECLI